jgi:hypothetical protein
MTVALTTAVAVDAPVPADTGTLRGDVLAFVTEVADALRMPLVSKIIPDLLAESTRNPELQQALFAAIRDTRRSKATRMLEQAVQRGVLL